MKKTPLSLPFLSFLPLLLLLLRHHADAQPATPGYPCSANQSTFPCATFICYRALAPDLLDLASIGELFGVSRLMISTSSDHSSPSAALSPNQQLLIPITCNCNANLSYSKVTYEMKSGDTFYLVSTTKLQNLTTYQAVEVVNPTLVPINLTIGVNAIFPVFCKCPNKTQVGNSTNFLITYVVQPSDTLRSIAAEFGSDLQSLVSVNGANFIEPYSTIFVPVDKIPEESYVWSYLQN